MLPADLKLITLRYGNACGACGSRLGAGERGYWSPAARGKAWCERCVRESRGISTEEGDYGNRKAQRSRPERNELPDDRRLITLKYDKVCAACGRQLHVGDRGYWSPTVRGRAWCQVCGRSRGESGTADDRRSRLQGQRSDDRSRQGLTSDIQHPWSRLCRYLSKCVLAESADTLLAFQDLGTKGFLHETGAEYLVTGLQDWAPVPSRLGRRLAAREAHKDDAAFNYGWPVLVARNQKKYPVIAPLFLVSVQVEQRDRQWIGAAEAEPEFNLSIVAGELFDMSAKEAVDVVVGDGLPFGDPAALVRLAKDIAETLGVEILSDIDPGSLHCQCDVVSGMYNAAVWIPAGDGGGAAQSLLDELDALARRADWNETAAASLVGERPRTATRGQASANTPLAGPLPCNGSQESALDRIRREPLTIVTGPPGTGKTQLVVNAVTNAWLDGETVLVASTNNGAVNVAVERANGDIGPGMLLRTGNRKAREALADRVTEAVAASADDRESKEQRGNAGSAAAARAELARTAARRARLLADLAAAGELSRKLAETVDDLERLARGLWKQDRAPDIAMSSRAVERRALRVRRAWFFRRRRTRRLLAAVRCEQADTSLDDLARWATLDQTRTVLKNELARTEARIGDPATSLQRANGNWAAASMTAARYAIRAGFKEGKQALSALARAGLAGASLAKTIRDSFRHARGWACTALSMQRSFRLERGLFDLVIIDEASQCSLATALPLAYRAKRLAVIGDPNQLTPVITLSDALLRKIAASELFDDDDLARRGAHYREGSAYFAFAHVLESDSQQPIVLDEHYRCHPHIARWFNHEFYRGALTVLTDVARMPRNRRSIGWIDVSGEAARGSAASWTNVAEAERAIQEITALLRPGCRSVGVVTPFAAQAALIDRMARRDEHLGAERLAASDFGCGTAHRFQGGERDAIVVSAVLTPGIPRQTAAWVERERYLINVAVSRARQSLILLGHPEIRAAGSPTLASLRTYLLDAAIADGDIRPATDTARTDSRAEARLLEAMRSAGWQPSAKLYVEGYELDFALLEQGLRLNVEVDGDHHVDARGRLRRQDLARDRILMGIGWDVIRIPAWLCTWDVDEALRNIAVRIEQGCPAG